MLGRQTSVILGEWARRSQLIDFGAGSGRGRNPRAGRLGLAIECARLALNRVANAAIGWTIARAQRDYVRSLKHGGPPVVMANPKSIVIHTPHDSFAPVL